MYTKCAICKREIVEVIRVEVYVRRLGKIKKLEGYHVKCWEKLVVKNRESLSTSPNSDFTASIKSNPPCKTCGKKLTEHSAFCDNHKYEPKPKSCHHPAIIQKGHHKFCRDCGELLETLVGSDKTS